MAYGAEEWIWDRRREPRSPLRCEVEFGDHFYTWEGITEDFGPGGCRVATDRIFKVGKRLHIVVRSSLLPDALEIEGGVAWSTDRPMRLGIAFEVKEARNFEAATDFFERMIATTSELSEHAKRVPVRLALAEPLFLAQPPERMPALSPEEFQALRRMADFDSLQGFKAAFEKEWDKFSHLPFALLHRGLLTQHRSLSVAPHMWGTKLLERAAPTRAAPRAPASPSAATAVARKPAAVPASPGSPVMLRKAENTGATRLDSHGWFDDVDDLSSPAVPPPASKPHAPESEWLSAGEIEITEPMNIPTGPPKVDLPEVPEDSSPSLRPPAPKGGKADAVVVAKMKVAKGSPAAPAAEPSWEPRPAPEGRGPKIQAYVDQAMGKLSAGDKKSALTAFKLAQMLAPADPEVEDWVAKLESEIGKPSRR